MFSTLPATLTALSRLLRRIRVSRKDVAIAVLLLLVGGGLEGWTVGLLVPLLSMLTGSATTPGFIQSRIDSALGGFEPGTRVFVLGTGIVVVVALKNVVTYVGVAVAGGLRARAVIELRRQLIESIFGAAPATLERHTSGEITHVILSEAWRVNRILDLFISVTHRSIIALSYLVAIVFLSWRLTIVTLVLGILLAVTSRALGKRALVHGRELSQSSGRMARGVTEIVGGLRVIRTTSSHDEWEGVFQEGNRAHANADLGASLSQSLMAGVVETLGIAGAMGLTAIAHYLWLGPGTLDVPSFLAFGFSLIRLLPALNQMYAGQAYITPLLASLEQVTRWLDLPRYPTRAFGKLPASELKQGIHFENVSLTYPNGSPALSDFSFFLPAGETLAILGASGSGKSSLASLVLRLREPTNGRILFDGTDHWEFDVESFSRAVAFVEQDPFLFNVSIAENVVCGRPGISRAAVVEALRVVRMADVIERLPEGVDTVLAERGATLSGGQRQRLAIARAIVANPHVLVLDEPTSALDPETEQEVVSAIDAASVGRTTIIITHRASTVEHATRRLYLSGGRIEVSPGGGARPALPESRIVADHRRG